MPPDRGTIFFALLTFAALALFLLLPYPLQEEKKEPRPSVILFSHFLLPLETVPKFPYIEIIESCGPYFEDACVRIRSGPSLEAPAVMRARTGMVLPIAAEAEYDEAGHIWYRIAFRELLRYPERVSGEWYVAADYARAFRETDTEELEPGDAASAEKRILVDRSEQMLYAYDGDALFLESPISTGLDLTPTPRGEFVVFRKTPSRYMQGPLPGISGQYYDLPGVPWNLYFTEQGGAIHGAYWHMEFGKPRSHGCVNLPLDTARTLYEWAPLGTRVTVRD